MKMLLCKQGLIGTKIGRNRDIIIDKLPTEDRGYTIVDDSLAQKLLEKEGYETVLRESYPRDFDTFYAKCKKNLQVTDASSIKKIVNTQSTKTQLKTYVVKLCAWCKIKDKFMNRQWLRRNKRR